ncbi:MAG TPA: hypothetical protein VEA99_14055 [Gemmatimonadaceae bacterium]|nr:hypothetical protein [Gemmatimonadaceae bacterium]
MRRSIQELLTEYGTVALVVYLVIFALTLTGFIVAIRFGWTPRGAAGSAGVLAAAYIATKLTQPIRIAATVVLTPIVAKLYERVVGVRRSP